MTVFVPHLFGRSRSSGQHSLRRQRDAEKRLVRRKSFTLGRWRNRARSSTGCARCPASPMQRWRSWRRCRECVYRQLCAGDDDRTFGGRARAVPTVAAARDWQRQKAVISVSQKRSRVCQSAVLPKEDRHDRYLRFPVIRSSTIHADNFKQTFGDRFWRSKFDAKDGRSIQGAPHSVLTPSTLQ